MPIYSQDDADSMTLQVSNSLRDLIEIAIDTAIDRLTETKQLLPAVVTRTQGEINTVLIETNDQNDVENKALLQIRPNSNTIDQYVVIYNALVQHQDSLSLKHMLIILAGEKGGSTAYRFGQPYKKPWFRPLQKAETLFLMGSAEQFLVGD